MVQFVATNTQVQRFGLAFGDGARRLDFPNAEVKGFEGQSGQVRYTAAELHLEGLRAQLDRGQWQATSCSAGGVILRDQDGRFELSIGRVEFPRGLMVARAADAGMELITQHASLGEVALTVRGPFRDDPGVSSTSLTAISTSGVLPVVVDEKTPPPGPPPSPEPPAALRQEGLRFLDGTKGELKLTIRVKLDLPVIGERTLDQDLRIPIQDGSLDFRALDKGLDWLEGTFLDIGLDGERLAVKYGVPIVLPSREIISWTLDRDALTLAKFDRVPLRSLVDFRLGGGKSSRRARSAARQMLRAFAMEGVNIALSLLVPRSLEVGGGAILFGGDDAPGIVDLKIAGDLRSPGQGALKGSIALLDTTIKDLHMGGATMTVDRLHLGSIDQIEVQFDGFSPTLVTARIDRVTATNMALLLGRRGPKAAPPAPTPPKAPAPPNGPKPAPPQAR